MAGGRAVRCQRCACWLSPSLCAQCMAVSAALLCCASHCCQCVNQPSSVGQAASAGVSNSASSEYTLVAAQRGEAVAVVAAVAKQLVGHPRALKVKADVHLIGDTHAAVQLSRLVAHF